MDSNNKSRGAATTPLAHLLLYSEDMRISKILRRLVVENNPAVAIDLCKKLEVAVRNQTNAAYICRSFEFLLDSMMTVLKQCPVDCASHASSVLGLIGYINRSDFNIYKNYITKTYQCNRGLQKYIMMALRTTISCDAVNLDLTSYSERLLTVLKDYLENAEAADNFVAISETIAEFSKNYKRTFETHFTDIVDIVVGWHLEVDQRHALKLHCSLVLQQFSQYFLKKLDFTYGLLGQFLEDIVTFGDDVAADGSTEKSRRKAEVRIGAFVGAFTSILKALANRTEFIGLTAGGQEEIIADALIVIMKAAKQALSMLIASEETILNINDFLCLIFVNNYNSTLKLSSIEELLELELQQFQHFSDQQQCTLLYLILCVIRQLRTQLPCSLVSLIFKTENNPLAALKLTRNDKLYRLFLKLYHDVLIIKNVPLLQEAYKHIKLDIQGAIEILESNANQIAKAEATLNFYLAALSALATQTSSIIGMYALYPSIVDLLISNCQAANFQLWQAHPILHSALVNVIVVHCQKNHNYRPTSRLLLTEHIADTKNALTDEKLSPTSENFSTILKFLADILSDARRLNTNLLNTLLNWLRHLLEECRDSARILQHNKYFLNICKAICVAATMSPIESAVCMEVLLKYAVLNLEILESFRDTSIHLIDSVDPQVRDVYSEVFARLPLGVSLATGGNESGTLNALQQRKCKIYELQQWYKCTTHFSPLRQKFFKPFLKRIELSSSSAMQQPPPAALDQFFSKIFGKCWLVQCREAAVEYQRLASDSSKMLTAWLQWEAARYCVQNKLRTTVGKPQDTFLAIEALIMRYARVLAVKDDRLSSKDAVINFEQLAMIQHNARILLGFLENLEKHIYCAGEGTAFAILPPEKPAKTFFRINAHTCNEWFKRIRTGVNLIAKHCMEPQMVVRYSEYILSTEKLSDLQMERTITSLVEALLCCGETDTLQGLHMWIKTKTDKSYTWIQNASEQSAGNKEQAAEGYAQFLLEHGSTMDASLKEFLIAQLLDCLYYTCQWSKMRGFLKSFENPLKEKNGSIHIDSMRSGAYLDVIESLYYGYNNPNSCAEVSQALLNLSEWPTSNFNDLKSGASVGSFSSYSLLRKIEDTCFEKIALNSESEISTGIRQAIHHGLQESLRHDCNLQKNNQLQDFVILNHVFQKLTDDEAIKESSSTTVLDCGQTLEQQSTTLTKCLLWTLLFEQRANRSGNARTHSNDRHHHALYLDIASSARREGNLNVSCTMLERFFAIKGFAEPSLLNISKHLQNNVYTIDIEDTDLLRGFSEIAKCMYVNTTTHQLEAIHLGASYCFQIMQQVSLFSHLQYPETSANMLLTMADWLMQRGSSSMMESPQLQQLLSQLPDVASVLHTTSDNPCFIISSTEKAIGKLTNAAAFQKNDSGEAWCAFGNWCYRWGKKVVEAKNNENFSNRLSQHDLAAITAIVGGESLDDEVVNQLVNVLNSHQLNVCGDGVEDIETNEVISIDIIENDLRKINVFANKPVEQITAIIEIWRQAHRSIYSYYEMAAKAYFKYLSIETDHTEASRKECNIGGDSTFVTVTLRLLRLIVKHAIGLQEVLEEGLRTTPLRPWKVIIPQLFSRLNHHEPYVRRSVSDLLCRLAQDRPHLIIFPAVVGAHQELKAELPRYEDLRPTANKTVAALSTCFGSLLLTLSKQVPETVLHVQLLVKELKRITLLWEEYWIHALAQLHGEYSTLFSALEIETKNCPASQSERITLKYEILLKHVVSDLQKIAAVTEKSAETNYERNFQERYNQFIKNTISDLQKPFNVSKPNESWSKIKQLYSVFQQRSIRGSASTLKITDLSPVLANMQNTSISMLGVDTFEKHPIHIKSVDNAVYILPTKTKPKKLSFSGSDGRKYTYLFKGLEDLHLDERIMQFLSISNSMLERSKDPLTATANLFKAQHYSVIPLGSQSGLISWVDGVTPLFAIYKKWQQRDTVLKQTLKERPAASAASHKNVQQLSVPAATRPSELFYNKLTPLLAEHKIKVTDPRKQWPLPVLRRVLAELSKETPKYLLAKELWCHASNAAEWRKSVRNYSLSVAVMSVIGYIIGLGDRHLDNVLIKLSTGEIVHIDYNVCFEKGKTLRVPEKVPFRMTPNLEEALGITGIEGAFRLGCEHVLKTLRKERETLLTLLEAFVYDPLVDWTISDDGTTTATRSTSAHAAAQSMAAIAANHHSTTTTDAIKDSATIIRYNNQDDSRQTIEIRFNEMKPYWMQYKDELIARLLNISNEIELLLKKRQAILQAEQERNNLTKQLAMIRELEALGSAIGSHALNTITQRYGVYKKNAEAFDAAKQSVRKYHSDLKKLLESYFGRLMVPSLVHDLTRLQLQLHDQQQQGLIDSEFDVIREFLADRSSQSVYAECDFARNEMNTMLKQKSHCAADCLELLQQYASVMQFYPRSRLEQSQLVRFERWYQQLDEQRDALGHDIAKFLEIETKMTDKLDKQTWALQYSAAMEKIWIELNFDLHKAINDFNELKQLTVIPLEVAITSIQSFMAHHNEDTLQRSLLRMIAKGNQNFLLFEDTALDESDPLLLERQMDYIDITLSMCRSVFPPTNYYASLEELHATLFSLRKLKSAFELPLSERIVRLFMLDTHFELQSNLDIICTAPGDLHQMSPRDDSNADELFALLAEVYGLFDEFEVQFDKLQQTVGNILEQMLDCDYKQFVQSRSFAGNLNHLSNDLKYKTISEIFRIARKYVVSFNNNNLENIYDVRLIVGPIIKYINHMQRSYLGGLTSLFAQALYNNFQRTTAAAAPQHNSPDVIPDIGGDALNNCSSQTLCQNLLMALQHNSNLKNQQLLVWLNTKWVEHYTLVATAHFWINEQMLRDAHLMYGHIIYKDKLFSSLQAAIQSLLSWKHSMAEIQSILEAHTTTVTDHLKWSVDDNQNLIVMQNSFHERVNAQNLHYRFHQHLVAQLLDQSETLLQFEMWSAYSGGGEAGGGSCAAVNSFLDIVMQWQYAYDQWRLSGSAITTVEQSIVQLLDPEDKIDQCWIENISGLLDEITFSVQRNLAGLEHEEHIIQDNLYAAGQQLQALIDTPIRMRIRHLLKSISKNDKKPNSGLNGETPPLTTGAHVRELQHMLKLFYAQLGELQLQLISRDFDLKNTLPEVKTKISDLLYAAEQNQNELFQLVQRLVQNNSHNKKVPSPKDSSPTSTINNNSGGIYGATLTIADKDKKVASQCEQKRNVYAVSVWKRIRMKLEGRDPDTNRRSTVAEQVQFIIREAMNPDNLAVLYEGWTPWV